MERSGLKYWGGCSKWGDEGRYGTEEARRDDEGHLQTGQVVIGGAGAMMPLWVDW